MATINAFSQINNSPTKALYSFSKSSRPSMAKNSYCDVFYNIPQTKSNIKASIGYGKKIDWDQLNKSKKDIPSPGTYNPGDFANMNKSARKGYSVGIGREETKSSSFIQYDKCVPGPQKYNIQKQVEGPKYSLRPRTASEVFVKNCSKVVPGPGRYDSVSSINPEGKYCISKWQSSRSKKFDPTSSARFSQKKNSTLGPGSYTPRNSSWMQNGSITQSKYTSYGNRVFGTGNRSTIFEDEPKKFKNIPGPGMYESFSDFGSINEVAPKKLNRDMRPASSNFYKK